MTDLQNDSKTCERCGGDIPAESPMGICPHCTLLDVSRSLSNTPYGQPNPQRPDIDGYDIGAVLGRGGMGDVYLATQLKVDRLVAIKVVRPQGGGNSPPDELKARFIQEAKALSALSHPSIVAIFDVGETNQGDPFFAMEYVEGSTLRETLLEGPVKAETILEWGLQICGGLDYAHGKGVIHRDIKPANVLVSNDGYIKLVDFGLAKLLPDQFEAHLSMTYSQVAVGTPDYVAPEQILTSEPIDHRADIYALGVLLYELATNRIPRGSWVAASRMNSDFGRTFDRILERALAPDPDDRYQTIKELQTRLGAVPSPLKLRNRRKTVRGMAAALLAGIAVFGIIEIRSQLAPPWGTMIPEFRKTPAAMERPPYNAGAMAQNQRPNLKTTFPLEIQEPWGTPRLFRLEENTLAEVMLPPEVAPDALHLLNWISESQFLVPAKGDGVAKVTLSKTNHRVEKFLEGLKDIVQVEGTAAHGLALRKDGKLFPWPAGKVHPFLPPADLPERVIKVAAGENHAVALLADGSIRVWGNSDDGKTTVPYPFNNIVDVATGAGFTAVLTETGRVFAWGDNRKGQCDVPPDLPPVAQLVCLEDSVFVLLENGLFQSWGDSELNSPAARPSLYKQLSGSSRSSDILAENTAGEWKVVSSPRRMQWVKLANSSNEFYRMTKASVSGDYLLYWKQREANEENASATRKLISLTRETSFGHGIGMGGIPRAATGTVKMTASFTSSADTPKGHVLALSPSNDIIAWGRNGFGQCDVPNIDEKVIDLAAGDQFSAALTENGKIVAWGAHRETKDLAPIDHLKFVFIDAGSNHGVALDEEGRFFGWGNNTSGQITAPDNSDRFRLLAAGGHTTMGITKSGTLRLWGNVDLFHRNQVPDIVQKGAASAKKIGVGGTTCWVLLENGTLIGWGNVKEGALPDIKKQRALPARMEDIEDFWCDKTGLIVRHKNGTYCGFEVYWSDTELTKRLAGVDDIEITHLQIFATIR